MKRHFLYVAVFLLGASSLAAQPRGAEAAGGAPGWTVSGVVRTRSGPIQGLYMSIAGPEVPHRSVQTDSTGRYRFSGTAPGTYTISMQKPEDASAARPRTITVKPGDRIEGVDFMTPEGAAIAGKVTDRAGRPVSGMVIVAYLRWRAQGRIRLSEKGGAVTDDKGEYRIGHLSDGTYLIGAVPYLRNPLRPAARKSKAGAPPAPAYPPVTFAPRGRKIADAFPVQVRSGSEFTTADIVMEKEPVYCIFFQPAAPMAPSGISTQLAVTLVEWVGARGPSLAGGGSLPSDDRDIQICGVPEGEYQLGLAAFTRQPMKGVGYGTQTVTVPPRNLDLGPVEASGLASLKGKIRLRGGGTEAPIPEGIRISLELLNRGLLPSDVLEGLVNPDGTFELSNVYADRYGLKLENLPKGFYVSKAMQAGQDILTAGLRPGDQPLDIELASDGPSISGRVLSTNNTPQPLADVPVLLLSDKNEVVQSGSSDQSGVYRFASGIAPGNYRLSAVPELAEPTYWTPEMSRQNGAQEVRVRLEAKESKALDLTVQQER